MSFVVPSSFGKQRVLIHWRTAGDILNAPSAT